MINFFNRVYSSIKDRNALLSQLRFYSALRFMVRLSANVTLPIYFRITQGNTRYLLKSCVKTEGRIIVSLTSFPARIGRLWLVIETLLRQTQKPDKIMLWLSEEQFPSLQTLPKNLLRLQKRGLEIRLCKGDLRSHKKYYYALQKFPEDTIITVDDDIYYRKEMIEKLITLSKLYPKSIIANCGCQIQVANGEILPYRKWDKVRSYPTPSFNYFFGSGGGILIPSKSLNKEVLNKNVFMQLCLYADDVWLNMMCRLNSFSIARTDYHSSLLPVMRFRNSTLASINVDEGMNDKQLAAVRAYCIETLNKDPFEKIETQNEK
jgi:hypothetical protein